MVENYMEKNLREHKSSVIFFGNGSSELSERYKTYRSGVDLGFSRGWRIFRALPRHYFVPILLCPALLCPAGQIFENMPKGVLRHFLICFDQKIAFFWRALPQKLVYIGAQGIFRNFLGSIAKNGHLKIYKGGPFGSAGGRIPKKEASHPNPSLHQLLQQIHMSSMCSVNF